MGAKNVESSPLLLLAQIYPYENIGNKIQQMWKIEWDKKITVFALVNSS